MIANLVANGKKGWNLNFFLAANGVVTCWHKSACRPYSEDDDWF
jgi:hypothetical protein